MQSPQKWLKTPHFKQAGKMEDRNLNLLLFNIGAYYNPKRGMSTYSH